MSSEDDFFDAVIIGSGFGGSVMAYRLAEAGLRVCLLERGKAYPPNSFPRTPYDLGQNFWGSQQGSLWTLRHLVVQAIRRARVEWSRRWITDLCQHSYSQTAAWFKASVTLAAITAARTRSTTRTSTAAIHQKPHPAQVETLCEVKFVTPLDKGYQVDFVRHTPEKIDPATGKCVAPEQATIFCKRLIISAGTFGSPYLLMKNIALFPRLNRDALGSRFSVNGDLLSFVINTKEHRNGQMAPRRLEVTWR